jgi:hypothetical protein
MYLSKYGEARTIRIAIPKAGSANHAVGADWTPAAGDVKISKDGGAAANVTNLPTAIAMGNSAIWAFALTATEMQAAEVVVTVADSATKAVDDTGFVIETYGHASAQHAFDLDTASTAQTGDSYAIVNSGTHGNAALKTLIDAIDDIIDTEVPAILVDTSTTLDDLVDDLESRLSAALSSKLTAHAAAVLTMTVDTGSTTTAVVLKTVEGGAASATNDFYNGRVIIFTSGALAGQATSITDYVGATKTCTVPALTGAPAEDVTGVIV